MAASSAVTINRSEQEITSQLSQADPLLTSTTYGSRTALHPATEGPKSASCWSRASPEARSARRWQRSSAPIPNVSSTMRSAASSNW